MELQEIKSRLSILTVLNYYGLKPDKSNMLHCPFHEDKTPSFQIYLSGLSVSLRPFCY